MFIGHGEVGNKISFRKSGSHSEP